MATVEVECPTCGEILELSDNDRAELAVGDIIACNSCHTELEVTQNDQEHFELELLGMLTECPQCGTEFDVTETVTAETTTAIVECPNCGASVKLDFEDA